MKTFLTIIITASLTWFVVSLIDGVHNGVSKLWLVSAIKAPGKMAIADIQKDMNEARYDIAKAKLQIFMDTWKRFDNGPDSNTGLGIGDICMAFSKVDSDHAVNKSQLIQSGTNQAPSAH